MNLDGQNISGITGEARLKQFFTEHPKCALAFSGGVDSAYLLYAAKKAGAEVRAYYVKAAFQPEFEFQDAIRLAEEIGADMKVLHVDVLSDDTVRKKTAVIIVKNRSSETFSPRQRRTASASSWTGPTQAMMPQTGPG